MSFVSGILYLWNRVFLFSIRYTVSIFYNAQIRAIHIVRNVFAVKINNGSKQ